jgi:hypothetical protein
MQKFLEGWAGRPQLDSSDSCYAGWWLPGLKGFSWDEFPPVVCYPPQSCLGLFTWQVQGSRTKSRMKPPEAQAQKWHYVLSALFSWSKRRPTWTQWVEKETLPLVGRNWKNGGHVCRPPQVGNIGILEHRGALLSTSDFHGSLCYCGKKSGSGRSVRTQYGITVITKQKMLAESTEMEIKVVRSDYVHTKGWVSLAVSHMVSA